MTCTTAIRYQGAGVPGVGFLAGRGAPAGTLGRTRDSYIDLDSGVVYTKAASGWEEEGDQIFAAQIAATAADRVQTGEDAAATAADRVATGADAVATAADRVQTGLDRVATGQDRVQTGLDRVATAADRVATGEDRVAVAADRAAVEALVPAATTAAAAAAASEVAAGEHKDDAETASTSAAGSVATATTQAGIATTKAGEAAASELAAATSAGTAGAHKDDAEAAAVLTAGDRAATLADRQLAETARTGSEDAYADTLAALAGITNYDNTLGVLLGGVKQVLSAADVVAHCLWLSTPEEMEAIRKGERARSYYKEAASATRGARKEMPVNKLVVAQPSTVTIYDLDSGTPVMWVSASGGITPLANAASYPITSVRALEGVLYVGSADNGSGSPGGLTIFDFIKDMAVVMINSTLGIYSRPIARRNDSAANSVNVSNYFPAGLVNRNVKSIDAKVLPGTPVDPVRGLPNPTVAVGTAGGLSVIHWNGSVADSASTSSFGFCRFGSRGEILAAVAGASSNNNMLEAAPGTYYADGFAVTSVADSSGAGVSKLEGTTPQAMIPTKGRGAAYGSSTGLSLVERDLAVPRNGSVALITDKVNTGVQFGDIRGCFAESTADLSSLVGATILSDDFSSYANTAEMLAAGWVESHPGSSAVLLDGAMAVGGAASSRYVTRAISTVAGATYRLTADLAMSVNGQSILRASTFSAGGGQDLGQTFASAPTSGASLVFTATGTTTYIHLWRNGAVNDVTSFDNILVTRVVPDRSIAGNHATVIGTVTRTPVATGAELAAYSGGISSANYLEVPYTSALNFGTGDFSVMLWHKSNGASVSLVERAPRNDVGGWAIDFVPNNYVVLRYGVGGTTGNALVAYTANGFPTPAGQWTFYAIVRSGGVLSIYGNGSRVAPAAFTVDLTMAGGTLRTCVGAAALGGGELCQIRIGATAPTPEQIRAIYEAEKGCYVADAKALLPAANVNDLSYDRSTDLLHVATTGGMARLRGCEVVSKDSTVVTKIMAREGYVATVDSNSADIDIPSNLPLRTIGHNGGPPLYDRRRARHTRTTTNATPTDISRFPLREGEEATFDVTVLAVQRDDGAQVASYRRRLTARRKHGSNVEVVGSVTDVVTQEVTSTMDLTIAATGAYLAATATGVASTNIEWTVTWEGTFNE